jgi:hypothetical protein
MNDARTPMLPEPRPAAGQTAQADRAPWQCADCCAVTYCDPAESAPRCPYCGATSLLPYDESAGTFRPERIVPFAVDARSARAAAARWARRAWLAPAKFVRGAREGRLRPVFLPFWTFDAHAVAHFDGAEGLHGVVELDFANLRVCGDRAADDARLDALGSFPAQALRDYAPSEVAGAIVAHAGRTQDEALRLARARMERELAATARLAQPRRARGKLRLRGVEYTRESCRRVLLPVWTHDVRRRGRTYGVTVNGATGLAAGAAPVSAVRVALLALAAGWVCAYIADALTPSPWIADALSGIAWRHGGGR